MTPPELMLVSEVSRKLGVSESCVRAMCDRGELAASARTSNGYRLFSSADVQRAKDKLERRGRHGEKNGEH